MSNIIEEHGKPRLYVFFWTMAAMLGNSVVVVGVRTRPRAIPLAMITIRKSTHGFPFLSHDACGAPLQKYFQAKIGRKIRIFSLGRKNNILVNKKKVYSGNEHFARAQQFSLAKK